MPAYSVYRPSVLRSGRLGVRAIAVVTLLAASVTALVVVTHVGGSSSKHTAGASSPAPDRTASKLAGAVAPATVVPHAAKKKVAPAKPVHHRVVKIPAPSTTPVAVLNGGTSQGAAASTASHLRALGYPVPVVGNAGRRDLPSAIEYSAGMGAAARALARQIGPVSYVTPFDGPARNLSGARLLVIIGT